MDRDEFIITVYCSVCEHYQVIKNTYPLRRGGFAPALSDESARRQRPVWVFSCALRPLLSVPDRPHVFRAASGQPPARQSYHPTTVDPGEWTSCRPCPDYRYLCCLPGPFQG